MTHEQERKLKKIFHEITVYKNMQIRILSDIHKQKEKLLALEQEFNEVKRETNNKENELVDLYKELEKTELNKDKGK